MANRVTTSAGFSSETLCDFQYSARVGEILSSEPDFPATLDTQAATTGGGSILDVFYTLSSRRY